MHMLHVHPGASHVLGISAVFWEGIVARLALWTIDGRSFGAKALQRAQRLRRAA